MEQQDEAQFVELLSQVLAYYKQPTSDFALTVWTAAMKPFTLEQVRKALSAHAIDPERGQFGPKVADIVRILQGTPTDRALLAWGKVQEAMGSVGAYQDVVFDDPAIHAAVEDCGGWPKVCRGDLKDLSYLQKRFCDAHKAYTARGEFDYPKRLAGDRSPDSEYEKKGLKLPKPAIVGNYEKAKEVHRLGGAGKANISFVALEQLAAPEFVRLQ